ncbi:glyoxalase family protein [Altererythrobacter sp. B11]|uniref:VOC family protein n=1 Tax=Altererythrobacter sp. B11 TaxID=2060312 RepID=UPI000DC6D903|nr:VOC family protein [Altererythrobacter sp. B11]BBC73775.1 glyoxalase family protein [Altererythrobacter sp. B11]
MSDKVRLCLWFDKAAREAAEFYAATFPESRVGETQLAPADNPSTRAGEPLTVEFTLLGIPCLGLNGGPAFRPNESVSFQLATETQEETDRYWHAIVDGGGQESMCGWCKDRWGFSWQITPRALTEAMSSPDAGVRQRAFEAMMGMKKIDIAAIEAAVAG